MAKWFDKYYSNPKREPVIIDYVRTPLGAKKGTLKYLRGDDMLVHTLRTIYNRNNDAVNFDEVGKQGLGDVIAGCNSQIGACALDVAKCASLAAGMPMSFPGVTLNRQCASGMQACVFGYEAIACGDKDVVVTGGVESQNVYPIMADMNVANGGPGGINITVAPNPQINVNPFIQESYKKYAQYEPGMQGQIYAAEVMGRVWQDKSGLSADEFRSQLDQLSVWSHEKAGQHFDDRALKSNLSKLPN